MVPQSSRIKHIFLGIKYLVIIIGLLSALFPACADKGFVKKVQASEMKEGAVIEGETKAGDEAVERTSDYWFERGSSYEKEARFKEAKDAFKEAVKLDPDFAQAHYHLGLAYRELGDMNFALRAFEEAKRINPDLEEVHYSLGLVNMEMGLDQAAIQAFKDVLRINPGNADAHYKIGKVYLGQHSKKEAKLAFVEATNIRPDFAEAHYELGSIYIMFNDIDSAFDEYRLLIDLDRKLAYKLFNQIYK